MLIDPFMVSMVLLSKFSICSDIFGSMYSMRLSISCRYKTCFPIDWQQILLLEIRPKFLGEEPSEGIDRPIRN